MGMCRCPGVDMGGRPMMCGRVMMGVMMCWVGGPIALVILCMWRCVVWSTLKERNYIINLISYTTVTKMHSSHNKKNEIILNPLYLVKPGMYILKYVPGETCIWF